MSKRNEELTGESVLYGALPKKSTTQELLDEPRFIGTGRSPAQGEMANTRCSSVRGVRRGLCCGRRDLSFNPSIVPAS